MPFSFKPDVEPVYVICRFTGARPVAVVVTFWPMHTKPTGQVTPRRSPAPAPRSARAPHLRGRDSLLDCPPNPCAVASVTAIPPPPSEMSRSRFPSYGVVFDCVQRRVVGGRPPLFGLACSLIDAVGGERRAGRRRSRRRPEDEWAVGGLRARAEALRGSTGDGLCTRQCALGIRERGPVLRRRRSGRVGPRHGHHDVGEVRGRAAVGDDDRVASGSGRRRSNATPAADR